jgi:hypothetical protein
MASADVVHPIAPAISDKIEPFQEKPTTRHDVQTVLNYHLEAEDGSPPAPTFVDRPETYDRPIYPLTVTVTDITGNENAFTLDSHGFQIVRHKSAETDFLDDAKIKAEYYPETEQLLRDATGASRIFIFDHTIRRQPKDVRESGSATSSTPLRGPVRRVHIDQSYSASLSRVPFHLPDEAEELLKGRFQIINVCSPPFTHFLSPSLPLLVFPTFFISGKV